MNWLKIVHVSCVVLSLLGFIVRGGWMIINSELRNKKWVKISPHIIDSLLLISAISMLFKYNISIIDHQWLQLKIILLVIYIGLGMIAFKNACSKKIRMSAFFMSLIVYSAIIYTAITRFTF